MSKEVILAIIAIIGPLVTGTITFLLSRKKYKAEVKHQEVTTESDVVALTGNAVHIYEEIMNKALAKQDELNKKELQALEARLTREINDLKDVMCMRLDCNDRIKDNTCPLVK